MNFTCPVFLKLYWRLKIYNMPKKEIEATSKEADVQSQSIDRLCAAVRMPGYGRGNILFVGWDSFGTLKATTDRSALSEQAETNFNITKAVSYPYGREEADLPLVPVEFVGVSKIYDRSDDGDNLTQDVLFYWISKAAGQSEQIQVSELDILKAIIDGQVVWEDFNEDSISSASTDTVTGQNMYTLFLPASDQEGKNVMYLMSFRPPMKNESNESMFRQFLIQTLTSLAKTDANQPGDHRKGYLEAIGLTDGNVDTSNIEGGLAAGVLDIMRHVLPQDLYKLSDERFDQIKKDSDGKGIATQMKIILREFGLYNLSHAPVTIDDLNNYSTVALLAVVATSYKLAERAIGR